MNKLSSVVPWVAIGWLLSACSQEPIVRNFELSAEPVVPSGSAHAEGALVHVELTNVEPVQPGSRLIAWAIGTVAADSVALGPVTPDAPTEIDPAPAGVALDAIGTIEITEEADGTALPFAQSPFKVLTGAFPGELSFPLSAADFAEATGTAKASDQMLDVSVEHLPQPPAGYRYVVWLGFAGEEGATHQHLSPQSGDHGGEPEPSAANVSLMQMGALVLETSSGHFESHDELFGAIECRLTLESLKGVDAASPCTTLRGARMVPEGSEAAEGHLH